MSKAPTPQETDALIAICDSMKAVLDPARDTIEFLGLLDAMNLIAERLK